MLTGFADVDDLIAAINTGKVQKYITKPWEPDDLRLGVQDALEKMELVRENDRLATELKLANEKLRTENIVLRQEVEKQVFPQEDYLWQSGNGEHPSSAAPGERNGNDCPHSR